MIIKRLILHNFGIYAGTNTFEFTGEKPVVLIGGMNGRGKTTFLSGVLLALYGANSFTFKESAFSAYGQYLKSFVNELDSTNESYIEMQFALNANIDDDICIKRSWNGNQKRVKEVLEVTQNGLFSKFLTDNWDMYVESVLPSGISNFFFFDGEKIAELAVEASDEQIKNSIRSLLGLNVIDVLLTDLNKVSRKIRKQTSGLADESELDALRKTKEEADANLNEMDQTISELTDKILEIQKETELEQARFKMIGGDIVRQQEEQTNRLSALKADDQVIQSKLLEAAASELPLFMVNSLLERMQEQAEKEQNNKNTIIAVNKLSDMVELYKNTGGDINQAKDFIEFFKQMSVEDSIEEIYNLSSSSFFHLRILNSVKLKSLRKDTRDLIQEKKNISTKINEAENVLAVAINHEAVDQSLKKIAQLIEENANLNSKLSECEEKRKELHGIQIKVTTEFNRKVESMLASLEYKDDNERALSYIHKVQGVLGQYEKKLQSTKIKELSETITTCYKQIADKKYLIEKVVMDADTLDFTYLNNEGNEVPKLSLSAGEKQMMVIAILWALAKCSRKKLPVIIDTPLSRLDGSHREALIKTYFPNASDQTIILSTDTEINHEYYQMMKPSIGDEFTLYYDDNTKSTTIKRGYVFGAEL